MYEPLFTMLMTRQLAFLAIPKGWVCSFTNLALQRT